MLFAETTEEGGHETPRTKGMVDKNTFNGPALIIILLSGLLLLTSCAGLPVRGMVGGQTIETRVDSEVARYYLGSYLAGKHSDAVLDARIDSVYQTADGSLPDRNELKQLSDDFSVDFAALYFADQIARVPVNRRFRSAFEKAYEYASKAFPEGQVRLSAGHEVLVVPTYLYKRFLATGADMAVPREALQKAGLTCHFVETDDDGPVEENADIVVAAIRAHAKSGRRLIILSASKSAPEVALALTKLGAAETPHVVAWINAVGALQGTPLADDRIFPELEYIVGKLDPLGMESMTTARSRLRFDTFRIPEHVLVVNYLGIPVSGTVSFWMRRSYAPMRKYGPNDGNVLLADMIFPSGITVFELGADHFMRNRPLDISTVALAITVINWLENPDGEVLQVPGGVDLR